ncbi:OB-fold nucleic acid binding domain-containing protein [Candidatus Pacearchaeota archaeon]|nr:OB-fold nucleic acid binding domain-containing protein [Candidatus Pacearchaeota archaeon]
MVENLLNEQKKRNTAYKLRIGDILKAKPVMAEGRFLYVELGEKKVVRVNLIANAVDKYFNDGEKKYASITIDDASGQIKLKAFGDEIQNLKDIIQGDTLQIIGTIREYNSEIYLLPEIARKVDPKWLLVRKLEMQNSRKNIPLPTNAPIRELILQKIKDADNKGGVEIEKMIMEIEASPDIINKEVKKLLEEGMIYEPRPGILRYLG